MDDFKVVIVDYDRLRIVSIENNASILNGQEEFFYSLMDSGVSVELTLVSIRVNSLRPLETMTYY